jgi:WD40 repeat protein
MTTARSITLPLAMLLVLARPAFPAPSFERDIHPILQQNCQGCHSAIEKKAKGGLSMDTKEELLKGGDEGGFIVAGKPDASLLIKMVSGDKPQMPKKQAPLTAAQVTLLRDWIAGGAAIDAWPSQTKLNVVIPQEYAFAPAVSSVAWSPDGKLIAAACRSEIVLIAMDSDQPPRRIATECDLITQVEFSPDGRLLGAAGGAPGRYGVVQFFDPADGRLIAARRHGRDTFFRGSFAPDSKALALGGSDGAAHIVPVDPAQPVKSIDLHSDWVLDVAYTPDGAMLVTAGRDKATKVASVEAGALLRGVDLGAEPVGAAAADALFGISANRRGELIAYEFKIALENIEVSGSGNGAAPISKRNQYAKNFEGQGGEVFDLAVSGDRKRVAAAGAFGEVRVYQIDNRQRVGTIAGVPAPVLSIALNADGTRVALGSRSGVVQLYDVAGGKLIKAWQPVPVRNEGDFPCRPIRHCRN